MHGWATDELREILKRLDAVGEALRISKSGYYSYHGAELADAMQLTMDRQQKVRPGETLDVNDIRERATACLLILYDLVRWKLKEQEKAGVRS